MALMQCKECGNEVSNKAESCPKCGVRVAAKPMGCGTLIGVIFLGVIIINVFTIIFSLGTGSGTSSASTSTSPEQKQAQAETTSPKSNFPTISVERIFVDDFRTTRATIRVRNDVETRGFSSVAIQCVWLSNGVAIDESSAETSSVGYGETTFKTMIGPGDEFKANEARCKVLRVR